MAGFLDVIDDCDNFPQYDLIDNKAWNEAMQDIWLFFLPEDARPFGYLTSSVVKRMPWTSDFSLDEQTRTVRLAPRGGSSLVAACSDAITGLLRATQDAGTFINLFKWPGEKFPVLGAPFPFAIDRAIAPYFGIATTGTQLTVYTRGPDGTVTGIWLAKRAVDKATFPGLLDNAAGGALDHGEMPFESLVREAMEEVGLDATQAKSGGTISWFSVKDKRAGSEPGLVEPGVQYVYDLEVDAETVLRPAEAGIEWLRLLGVEEVKAALCRREFKPSCACVMLDFFVRHGIINAENEADFAEIVSRLHRRLPVPVTHPQKA